MTSSTLFRQIFCHRIQKECIFYNLGVTDLNRCRKREEKDSLSGIVFIFYFIFLRDYTKEYSREVTVVGILVSLIGHK